MSARLPALGLILLALFGCARIRSGQPPAAEKDRLYEADTMVLESVDHGPMLCLGSIATSLPPQCGDVAITNWDWDEVENEERAPGTTWGDYHVVGTFDGTSFTVTETGKPRPIQASGGDAVDTRCPEPEGGWRARDPSKSSENLIPRVQIAQRKEPDFAGLWVDYANEEEHLAALEAGGSPDPGPDGIILNLAFTGDLERHETQIREEWGGPLCLVEHERTEEELNDIQSDLDHAVEDLGLQMLYSSTDVVDNVVELEVVLLTAEDERALEERYGAGAVRASGVLQPVG